MNGDDASDRSDRGPADRDRSTASIDSDAALDGGVASGKTTAASRTASDDEVPVAAFREVAARLADGDLGARFPAEETDGE
ncbi:hypothetical protein, partial [Halorubrum sp. AJ67]